MFKPGTVLKELKIGKKTIIFRYPRRNDVRGLLVHINSLIEEKAYIRLQTKQTIEQEKEFVRNTLNEMKKGKKIMIVVEVDGKIIGTGDVEKGSNGDKHIATLGIALSKYRNIGIGTKLIKLLCNLAKNKLNCKIIELSYYEKNERARHVYEKCGFREVGKIPKGCHYYGKYMDQLIMVKEV